MTPFFLAALPTMQASGFRFPLPFDNILTDIVYGALLGLVLWAGVRLWRVRGRTRSLAACLVDPKTFTGPTFTYKGGTFDRERYVKARVEMLEPLRGNAPKLRGRVANAKVAADNNGKDAVLEKLEIEALNKLF